MKKKTQPKKKAGKVTSVTISRLYNLGNYQNISYSLSAQVGPDESAEQTFRTLYWILSRLGPLQEPDCKDSLDEATKLPIEQQSEYQKANVKRWAEEMAAYHLMRSRKVEAIKLLDGLGGVSKFTDHKDNWDEDEPF
jgi:hypothetical protein